MIHVRYMDWHMDWKGEKGGKEKERINSIGGVGIF